MEWKEIKTYEDVDAHEEVFGVSMTVAGEKRTGEELHYRRMEEGL